MNDAGDRVAWVRERLARSRFHEAMGMRLERLEPGSSEVSLRVGEDHVNLVGVLHGGVISSLADTATGLAMHAALDPRSSHLTTSLQLTFLAPAKLGETVRAHGRVVKRGRRFGYAEADVLGPEEVLVARAAATFVVLAEDQ